MLSLPDKTFTAHPIYLSFSKFSDRQYMFLSRNLRPNMPKLRHFHWKIPRSPY